MCTPANIGRSGSITQSISDSFWRISLPNLRGLPDRKRNPGPKINKMANSTPIGNRLISAPKGQKDSAQGFNLGFNPGFGISTRRALKVAPDWRRLVKVVRQYSRRSSSGATFRAHLFGTINPGLKPWAELCCPFGADYET